MSFDLVSYGRRGPGRREHFSPAQIAQIGRTVGRTPEVMVKVLPRGATTLAAVGKHLDYIDREGELDLETDDGQALRGAEAAKVLLEDWDLELDELRGRTKLFATRSKRPPKLVQKLMFSMPADTPPKKVLQAVRAFCREEFALKHRYAMALHTDEPHPHVHVVVKAVSENGERLHISNEKLRRWREDFAEQLRTLGISANATRRYVRGQTGTRKRDEIYRAGLRGESRHLRERTQSVAEDLRQGRLTIEPGKAALVRTREEVAAGWRAVGEHLSAHGQSDLAGLVRSFMDAMPPVRTEREQIASELVSRARADRTREFERSR